MEPTKLQKQATMPTLVLLRHGTTVLSEESRFAGWADTPLSAAGMAEARAAGRVLAAAGFRFDFVATSRLIRAQQTLEIALEELKGQNPTIARDWRLNERHYGALQGERRLAMVDRYGNEQVALWRRDYNAIPPLLEEDDPRFLEQVARLPDIPDALQPRSESMKAAAERVAPVWHEHIVPAIRADRTTLVVAHTSAIRGIARLLENLDDEACASFRIATAVPRVYQLDREMVIRGKSDLTSNASSVFRYWINRLKPGWVGWI
jgi:2,3-bisphosphoglycerate-dependent phosphoglycerate mutase